jgi:hypothetical protein
MILDRLTTFTGTPPSFVDAVTTTADATNIIDLGLVGLPSFAQGGGARDIAIGDDPMLKLLIEVTTAFNTSANTLTCSLSGAPDNGSGVPGAFTTMWTGPAVAGSAMTTAGVYLANVDVPRPIPGQPMPRFLKVTFTCSGALAAGSVYAGIVIDRFDQVVGQIPGGGTALGGYVPGITVPN